MSSKLIFVISCALLALSDSAYVDNLMKCEIDDTSCEKQLIQNVIKDISKTGIKELNIQPIDPIGLHDITIAVLGLVNITVPEGKATGIKDCVIENMVSDYKKGHAIIYVTCDVNIDGKYKMEGNGPLVENLFGGKNMHGEGNVKAKVEKLHLKLQYFYDLVKKDDGNIYIKCDKTKFIYDYDMEGAKIDVDKVFLGDEDATETVVAFLNDNWKFVLKSFGKDIFDVAMDIMSKILINFFDNTPTNKFISTDLTPYVTI